MNRKIEVPMLAMIVSVGLNILLAAGLVVALLVPSVRTVQVVEVRATATDLPSTATNTPTIIPTASNTPTPRPPTATPVPCKTGETPGVDCPIVVGGLAVTVVSQESSQVYPDRSGQKLLLKDEYESRVIHLRMPLGTTLEDLGPWVEDGGMHSPMLVDKEGNRVSLDFIGFPEEVENGFGVVFYFIIPKGSGGLIFVIQPGDEVDLSLVPDITVASVEGTPASSSSEPSVTPTPSPTATKVFELP